MTETESRQVRRARERAEASPPRLFETSPFGNREQRQARPHLAQALAPPPVRAHPTKRRAAISRRRLVGQLLVRSILSKAAEREERRADDLRYVLEARHIGLDLAAGPDRTAVFAA